MKTYIRIIAVVLLANLSAVAQLNVDSASANQKAEQVIVKSTARLHSKGLFAYGGRIASNHPSFDINVTIERKHWGVLLYKVLDLADHTSANNFSLLLVYRNFKLGERVTIAPYVGVFLEQPHSFAGHGSDAALVTISTFKATPHFTAEHTALLGNLIVVPEYRDWVNRFRLLYTNRHLEVIGTFWHNNHMFDEADYASCAFTIGYRQLKLSEKFTMNLSATDILLVHSSNENSVPEENKVMVTLAVQFSSKKN